MERRTIVGKHIDFRGLIYAPINEQGVVFLFGKVAHEFGMYVELIRTGYPDCIAKRYIGKDRWEEIKIEFEFRSSDFKRHKHKIDEADMIVCWAHDWVDCPKSIEILELQNEISKLENIKVEGNDKGVGSSEYSISDHLKRADKETQSLFIELDRQILKISDEIYSKPHKFRIFYYSPRRVFSGIKIMKHGLNIELFTNAAKIKGVESFNRDYAQKWGRIYVKDKRDISKVISALKKSHKNINYCINNNLNTGWYAEAE